MLRADLLSYLVGLARWGGSNDRPSPADQLDEKNNQRKHEQNVNEPAQRVAADNTKQPQNKEDYKYCPEHFANTSRFLLLLSNFCLILLSFFSTITPWTPPVVAKVVSRADEFEHNLSMLVRTTAYAGYASATQH